MTLIHVLNTLDVLMERIVPKPNPEVAQRTYHELLQHENQRTYASIARIQSQIEDLQAGQDSNSTSPEKSIDSAKHNFQTACFTENKLKPEIIVVQPIKNRLPHHK
jgi:hypothetical protein